ncbi:hypothetical protein [Hymenobacter crusticola]|nr:hypothetical protein [Hymenobacter crusticola]
MSACTAAVQAEVAHVLGELNAISRSTQFVLGDQAEPDLKIYLVPKKEMGRLFHGAQEGSNGMFGFETSACGESLSTTVAVSTGVELPGWKESIIREEIA